MSIHFIKGDREAYFEWEPKSLPNTGDTVQVRGGVEQDSPKNMEGVVTKKEWYFSISNRDPVITITLE